MTQTLDVARYLLWLAQQEAEPELVSHLRLQKLLYYVQGWSLAMRGEPMFASRIEAWRHGPVVKDAYAFFVKCGDDAISEKNAADPASLSDEDKAFIRSVWEHYKVFSASRLRTMTHAELPWLSAWGERLLEEASNEEISHDTMRRFFLEEFRRQAVPGLELETMKRAEADFAAGRFISLADLKARRRHAI